MRAHIKRNGTAVKEHPRLIPQPPPSTDKTVSDISPLSIEDVDPPKRVRHQEKYVGYEKFLNLAAASNEKFHWTYTFKTLATAGAAFLGCALTAGVGLPVVAVALFGVFVSTMTYPFLKNWRKNRETVKHLKSFYFDGRQSKEYLEYAKKSIENYPKTKENEKVFSDATSQHERHGNRIRCKSTVEKNGLGIIEWEEILGAFGSKDVPVNFYACGTLVFHPEVDFLGDQIDVSVVAPGVNLRKANMEGVLFTNLVDFSGGDFRGANLNGVKFANPRTTLLGADLRDSTIRGVDLRLVDIRKCDLRGANLSGTQLPTDIEGVKFDLNQYEQFIRPNIDNFNLTFETFSLEDALKKSEVSEKQFEFLVLSGTIIVLDELGHKVNKNFDLKNNFVPLWEIERFKKTVSPESLQGEER